MSIRNVLQFGDPTLRTRCDGVVDFASHEVVETRRDLEDTLRDLQRIHHRGGGIAAPQIGSLLRIVYINARERSFGLFNPVIVERSDEMFEVWDFCFSANAAFLAKVRRHRGITLEYQDESGAQHREKLEGYFSELLQHEIDHLDGVLFVDRIERPETITMVAEWDKTHVYSQADV